MMRLPCWNMEGGLEDEIAWLEQGVRISRLDCLLVCLNCLVGRDRWSCRILRLSRGDE